MWLSWGASVLTSRAIMNSWSAHSPSSQQLSQTFLRPGHAGPCPSPETDSSAPTFALFLSLGFVSMRSLTFCHRDTLQLDSVPPQPFPLRPAPQSDPTLSCSEGLYHITLWTKLDTRYPSSVSLSLADEVTFSQPSFLFIPPHQMSH